MADMNELKSQCLGCEKCALGATRTNLVFGVGNERAEVMLIGEGPGEQEDLQGIPFVGRAGKLLDDMLEMIDLDRTKVYIANIVKCRPPKNRDPLPEEKDACRGWLKEQIKLVNPKIIICLGRIAATEIIDSEFKITRQHGEWLDVDGIRCTAIYHPAALLRDEHKRPETFADLREIRAEIKRICDRTYD
ncbi:MAG: uracil-DNA glycosylase [Bacillota bacterium]|nr:uracil-DNA glycosylase [Bacillota bacterium]